MTQANRIVLNLPRKESATKAENKGTILDTPVQMLTFLAAVEVGWWSSFVRYVTRFADKPKNENRSTTAMTACKRSKWKLRELKDEHRAELERKCSYIRGIWQLSNHPWRAFFVQSRPSCHPYGCYKPWLVAITKCSMLLFGQLGPFISMKWWNALGVIDHTDVHYLNACQLLDDNEGWKWLKKIK